MELELTILQQLLDVTAAGPVTERCAREALALGRALLTTGDTDAAAVVLRRAAMNPATQLLAHNLIETYALPGAFAFWMGIESRIAPEDDVYGFFTGHGTWSSPLRDYLADGWRTLSELMLLLERTEHTLMGCGQVLEFASGHGRFTRHLVKALGSDRITISDIVPSAVAFARTHFDVRGFVSCASPADVQWPSLYGMVFVLSLFSHLPSSTWQAWLLKLWEAVEPGGLLILTTHGEFAAQKAGVKLDENGFYFVASSESKAIDAKQYGTAFTSRAFVRKQMAALSPQPVSWHMEPAWFWAHQDAYVLQKSFIQVKTI